MRKYEKKGGVAALEMLLAVARRIKQAGLKPENANFESSLKRNLASILGEIAAVPSVETVETAAHLAALASAVGVTGWQYDAQNALLDAFFKWRQSDFLPLLDSSSPLPELVSAVKKLFAGLNICIEGIIRQLDNLAADGKTYTD